ncbi:MAG: TlpA family protein disulfide reductase [Nitrospiraceae bacterium]|nr:MAG: TlpA family protein disulfide reductase [Nitrospiraceae bacterium]
MRKIVILFILIMAVVVIISLPKNGDRQKTVVAVGLKGPAFSLSELDIGGTGAQKTWTFSDLQGTVVFINYWATWCKECREEMPSMQRLYDRMQGKPFQMLTILYRDDPKRAVTYMKENGYTMPVLLDPDTDLAFSYGVTGVPETYVADKEGVIREKIIGPRHWDDPGSTVVIESLL